MVRYLLSILLALPIFAYHTQTNLIIYGGLTLECHWGCGDFLEDPDAKPIESILTEAVRKVFRGRFPICPIGGIHPDFAGGYRPWIFDECEGFTRYDWLKTNGFYVYDAPYKSFNFQDYPSFLKLAEALREDCQFYWHDAYAQELQLYESMLPRLREELREQIYWSVDVLPNGQLEFYEGFAGDQTIKEQIKAIKNAIPRLESSLIDAYPKYYEENKELLEQAIGEADARFRSMFLWCLENHQSEGIAFHAALEEFIGGDFESALEKIRWLIDVVEKHDAKDDLLSKLYLLKGQVQSEYGLYADAIIELTTAIQKDPSMKEAYFERAAAYFEDGQFDLAIEDYIASGFHSGSIESYMQLSLGVTAGIVIGAGESAIEFIPSMLSTLRGLGGGLWALTKDPVGASKEFVHAAIQCIEYLKSHSSATLIQNLVPELKELIQNYDQIEDFHKGTLIGHVIGKYGMDIFLAKEGATMVKAYRDLKRANQVMTLEALASPGKTSAILAEADKRWTRIHLEALRNGEIKINPQKQGGHIVGHPKYQERLTRNENPSIFEHPDPNRLIREHAGTGIKDRRALRGDLSGMPGYIEIVDFKEFIGYAVDKETRIRTPTTTGKIHYAKDGVHIVPYIKRD
jgi:tetratricopeptide (TPR) repeat protein